KFMEKSDVQQAMESYRAEAARCQGLASKAQTILDGWDVAERIDLKHGEEDRLDEEIAKKKLAFGELQGQIENAKRQHSGYDTLEKRAARVKELDEKIREKEDILKDLNRQYAEFVSSLPAEA